jgi:hypothetical protein
MYRLLRSCTVLLILAAAGGCGTSSTSFRSELDAVAPKPQQASLEAHVFGAPSEVRFYVNGKRIKRGLEGSTFKDARLGLQLPPGVYRVEARFRIGEFEGRRLECRVSCLEPLRIRSGESVRLHADMRRDWSHPTEDRFSSFQSRPAGDNGLLEVSGHSTHTIPTAVKYPAHITKEMYAGMRAELLAKSDDPWDGRRSADAITIRGNQVVDDGQDAPAPAANAAPPVAVGGHHVEVGLAVRKRTGRRAGGHGRRGARAYAAANRARPEARPCAAVRERGLRDEDPAPRHRGVEPRPRGTAGREARLSVDAAPWARR